jgi:hypothetical protein
MAAVPCSQVRGRALHGAQPTFGHQKLTERWRTWLWMRLLGHGRCTDKGASATRRLEEIFFGEPNWDILLDLFIAHLENRVVRIGALGGQNTVAASTILRRAAVLRQRGLICRKQCPPDACRADITLSVEGVSATYRLYSDSKR